MGDNNGEGVPDLRRLPKSVVPRRYELRLSLEPEARLYSGQVQIRVVVHDHIDTVWLHALDLEIHEASIRFSHFSLPSHTSELVWVREHECVGLKFPFKMERGSRGWLNISFSGIINDNMQGLFALPFRTKEGNTRWGAATLFAATKARTCFPCFDEPDLKAVFALELTVPPDLVAISNMSIMDSKHMEKPSSVPEEEHNSSSKHRRQLVKRRTDYFNWTKEMSSYLLCFVVADFEYLERKTSDSRTTLRIYTPWGQREQGRFALEVAQKCLEYFNDYFGVRYPLSKLDLVAVSRLSVAAMENWGLILARESAIVSDNEASVENKQSIAMLVAHEVSHQWFGDLVTMQWWDALYLNEGFATLMQYLCIQAVYPELNAIERFCNDTVLPALGLDALRHSHPIELTDMHCVEEAFDNITYCKGASVLFMVHDYLGKNVFNKAIKEYMQEFAYDNASSQDLWYELSAASRKDVGLIMHNWITQLGFPLISVDVVDKKNGEKGDKEENGNKERLVLRLQQRRFASSNGDDSQEEPVWHVPLKISYRTTKDKVLRLEHLLDSSEAELPLESDFDPSNNMCWLKVDSSLTGFFRVHYSQSLLNLLISHLRDLQPMDRVALFSDLVAIGHTEEQQASLVLDIVNKLAEFESSHLVWKTVTSVLQQIRAITWSDSHLADSMDEFCLETVLRPQLMRLGDVARDEERHGDAMLRPIVFQMAAEMGETSILLKLHTLFEQHISHKKHLAPSIKEAVYTGMMVMANPGNDYYEQLLRLYAEKSELAEDRSLILKALGKAGNGKILERALQFALHGEDVQPQDAVATLTSAAATRTGHRIVWQFFLDNLEALLERYSSGLFLFDRLLQALTETLNRDEDVAVVDKCFENVSISERAVELAKERVRLNCQWRRKESRLIKAFLCANGHI